MSSSIGWRVLSLSTYAARIRKPSTKFGASFASPDITCEMGVLLVQECLTSITENWWVPKEALKWVARSEGLDIASVYQGITTCMKD